MKICFLGAGALGSTIGALLSEGGSDVWLINHRKEHVDAINSRGLIITEGGSDRVVKVKAQGDTSNLEVMDLLIVLVKSFHTEEALRAAGNVIGHETAVMSLQNGLGNEETIASLVGGESVVSGRTYVGGRLEGPGKVVAGILGKKTVIGEMDGRVTDRIRAIAHEFKGAGLEIEVSENIKGMIWDKLLVNAATGPLTAITRLNYGDLYKMEEMAQTAQEAVAEGVAVARKFAVALDTEDPKEIWLRASAGMPDDFKTSMLQGMERKARSEIDYINGAIVRYGEKAKIPTPVNKTLVACIKGIERSMGVI